MASLLRRRRTACVVAVALALLAAGCSDSEEDPKAAPSGPPSHVVVTLPPEPPGIRMSFIQQRRLEGTTLADVRVINITDRSLPIRRIGLEWPGYPGEPQAFAADVSPGRTLDLHYELPRPDCSIDPATPATGIAVAGGRRIERTIDEAGMRFLTRIWGAACARLRVDGMLAISYDVPEPATAADVPEGGGLTSTMPLGLRLERRRTSSDSSAVVVDAVQGTVLFDLTLTEPDVGLEQGGSGGVVPLVVDPGRCDEHARSQATQPFAFRLWLRIGDDPELVSVLAVPDHASQLRLLKFLDLACGDRTAH
jgi:hypothetical protein